MSLCSLCMRILTCSCISVSGHSGTFPFLPVCIYTEILQYFIIFIIPVCPDIMHSVWTYTCLSYTLAYKLTPALSYTVIWPVVHLFTLLTTLINTTQFPLPDLFVCSCSPCMLIPRPSCFFCVWPLRVIFSFILPCIYREYFFIFINIPVCPDTMHSQYAHVSVPYTHTHFYIALSVIWPFCPSVCSSHYTYQYHLISLGRPVCVPVFSLYTHSQLLLFFLVSDHTFSYFPLFSLYIEQRIL
ncbi:hypothetical protein NERG_02666 [Nematocida ausubeli]|uniref:Uncharacterized protein n=1 Tax=Nematocida ausubeli (strain ATCC PRA-371 / ERTm2) TaxID=1913371 RepID=H8ZGE5_NEMA1|nr:hypothetical protein NERG_02666 [Nematocida ausubeli]